MLLCRLPYSCRALVNSVIERQYSVRVSRYKLDAYNAKVSESVKQFKEERRQEQRKMQRELFAKRCMDRKERAKILEANQLENEKTTLLREEQLKKQEVARDAKRRRGDQVRTAIREEELKEQLKIIKDEIESSRNFITRDTLDKRIEEALNTTTNVEFAITVTGEKIFDE
ncbi:small ribosomal subunit protein mS26-like [Dysidea avara]|uniref:small ribosomal subunit protein mS26-like n=1 Tax=Dysidea avara TaxID=196820 RepID=UPI00331A00A5